MEKKVTFLLNGKEYTFEWCRKSMVWLEKQGYSIRDLADEDKAFTQMDMILKGALAKNHPELLTNEDIYEDFVNELSEEYDVNDMFEGLVQQMADFFKTTQLDSERKKKKTIFSKATKK